MKRILLFACSALLGLQSFAQGQDVTSLIQNAGFDEDFTFMADGSTKNITDKTNSLSTRSQAWIAADGSVYARAKDGKRNNETWYGFIGQISGWTVNTNKKVTPPFGTTGPEWVYFGSFPYDLGAQAVPIADGTEYQTMPAKPEGHEGDDNKGALYLRAGWGGACSYVQNVAIPAGKYRLEYWVLNTNFANSQNNTKVKNLTKVICRRDTTYDEDGFNAQAWTRHEIEFTPTSDITIEFGFQSDGSSSTNPILWIDGIKLYKTGDLTEAEIIQEDINAAAQELDELLYSVTDYNGLTDEVYELQDRIGDFSSDDVAELTAFYNEIVDKIAAIKKAKETAVKIVELQKKITNLLSTTDYPGKAALQAANDEASDVLANGNAEAINAEVDKLNDAITAYMTSQGGSEENPANYTFFVKHPWFVNPDAEPTANSDGTYTFPKAEANNYANGSKPSDANSDGWYIGAEGGDQRVNYVQQRTCWNGWNNNLTSMSISQDLTGLPNGYYKVSADLITQTGCLTDQHVYATSTLEDGASGALTVEGWQSSSPYNGTWTTLTTGKVLVSDGKLTIGVTSTGDAAHTPADFGGTDTDHRRGWFCTTNFQLLFVGEATQEDIDAALAKKTEAADALANSMHLAAINAYKQSLDITVLNNGIALGNKSEAKYEEIMADGKTIPTVNAKFEADPANAYGTATPIVKYAKDNTDAYLNSANATYTELDSVVALIKNYATTYAPVYNSTDSLMKKLSSATAKEALQATLDGQKEQMTGAMQPDSVVNALVAQLKQAMTRAKMQDVYESNPDNKDYTSYIQNPDAAAETGWTLDKGTGNTNTSSGQYWDPRDSGHRYFDSWNGTAGALNYYGEQVITDLPNGIYTVGVEARTTGEGSFVFAGNTGAAKEDTVWLEIPKQTYTYIDDATGETMTVDAADTYGQIWEDAKAQMESDPTDVNAAQIASTHGGKGFGWERLAITNVEVKDHRLVIGMTTDSLRSGKPFTGTWFSIVNWTLTLNQLGDNTDWDGPITGVKEIESVVTATADAIYTINGVKVTDMSQPGLYIVIQNGKAKKVLKK